MYQRGTSIGPTWVVLSVLKGRENWKKPKGRSELCLRGVQGVCDCEISPPTLLPRPEEETRKRNSRETCITSKTRARWDHPTALSDARSVENENIKP